MKAGEKSVSNTTVGRHSRMNKTLNTNRGGRKRFVVGSLLWLASLVALLNLRALNAPAGWDHALCGRWGCAPPLMTVVGWHGFLLVAQWGPLHLLYKTMVRERVRTIGGLMLVAGAAAAVTSVIVAARGWNGSVISALDFVRASLNAIVSRTDLPSLQFMILGASSIAFATRWSKSLSTETISKPETPSMPESSPMPETPSTSMTEPPLMTETLSVTEARNFNQQQNDSDTTLESLS